MLGLAGSDSSSQSSAMEAELSRTMAMRWVDFALM